MKGLTPKQIARELGKSRGFVVAVIRSGELVARDMRMPGVSIPRYEIDRHELDRFLRLRVVIPEIPVSAVVRSAKPGAQVSGLLARRRAARRDKELKAARRSQ